MRAWELGERLGRSCACRLSSTNSTSGQVRADSQCQHPYDHDVSFAPAGACGERRASHHRQGRAGRQIPVGPSLTAFAFYLVMCSNVQARCYEDPVSVSRFTSISAQ